MAEEAGETLRELTGACPGLAVLIPASVVIREKAVRDLGQFRRAAEDISRQGEALGGLHAQTSRLTKLEHQSTHHQLSLDEMAQSHTRRMDNIEAEIVQLQKMTPQSSPVHSPSAVGPSTLWRAQLKLALDVMSGSS